MSDKIKFQFLNVAAQGGTREITVQSGTTIGEFLKTELGPGAATDRMLVRVNRVRTGLDHILEDGQRVTLSPTDVSGA